MHNHAMLQTEGKKDILSSKTQPHRQNGNQAERKDTIFNAIQSSESLNEDQGTKSGQEKIPADGHESDDAQDSDPDDCLPNNPNVAYVLQIVRDAPLDIEQIIDNFSCDDYADLLEVLTGTYPRLPVLKLVYLYGQDTLLAMSPSTLYHGIVSRMARMVNGFINGIGHDQVDYDIATYQNKRIWYNGPHQREGEDNRRQAILDFQARFEITHMGKPLMIQKWIGEVVFATSASETRDHLKEIVDMTPSIDLVFLFHICESPEWQSPSLDDIRAQKLHAEPLVDYDDFNPTIREDGMKVVWRDFTWISIAEISVEVYTRSLDGKLTINVDQQSEYSARGTLFSSISMDDVDRLLADASRALKSSLLTLMELGGGEPMYVDAVRQSMATLTLPWTTFCRQLRNPVVRSAHERYVQWRRTPANNVHVISSQ